MSFKLVSLIQEAAQVAGLGPVTLKGAAPGMGRFADVLAEGDRAYALIEHVVTNSSEVCAVTMTGGQLVRGAVLRSSNGGAPVSFVGGEKLVSLTVPGEALLAIDDLGKTSAPTPAVGDIGPRIATTAFCALPDVDLQAYFDAVASNGGTVSSARQALIAQLIAALKAAGTWDITDDYWLLVAENSQSALTSLKQRRLATAVAAPVFTADRGYAFDGAASYLNTGFIPGVHGRAMSTNNVRLAVYERIGAAAATNAAGTVSATGSRALHIRPQTSTGLVGAANTAQADSTFSPVSPLGMTSIARDAALAANVVAYRNGIALTRTASPSVFGATLPGDALYIGGANVTGTLTAPRASTLGFVSTGALLSAAQELAAYQAVQAYMTATGANV